jgi:hypothetical protein
VNNSSKDIFGTNTQNSPYFEGKKNQILPKFRNELW